MNTEEIRHTALRLCSITLQKMLLRLVFRRHLCFIEKLIVETSQTTSNPFYPKINRDKEKSVAWCP